MSPKTYVLRALSPGRCYWEAVETLGSGVCAVKGDSGYLFLSLSLCSLAPELSNFASTHIPAMRCCLATGLKHCRQLNHELELPKL
jgi:hypothetical protein